MIEPLRLSFDVACDARHAFDTWTARFGTWWPKGHTVSGRPDAEVVLEPRVGGRIFERTPDGAEVDWGEVVAWDPPHRLAYLWHIRRDRADATDVVITFVPLVGETTRVDIVHTGWERLGAEGPSWRDANAGGWNGLLPHFVDACLNAGEGAFPVNDATGQGTKDAPWVLTTPTGQSQFEAWRDEAADPPALVVQVGKTQLRYDLRCIDDLHGMLQKHGDWMPLGSADEQKPAPGGTVEAWARSGDNPVGGWYGLRKGYRGRFGNYVPPVLERLGLAEVEHNPRNNRMRATS